MTGQEKSTFVTQMKKKIGGVYFKRYFNYMLLVRDYQSVASQNNVMVRITLENMHNIHFLDIIGCKLSIRGHEIYDLPK